MLVRYQNVELDVRPDDAHEWLLESALVAEGYGVTPENIRWHKSQNADEFTEGKHFISVSNPNANPRGGIPREQTYWTKKGVVRLGFFIRSERAKSFRDWAEDLIVHQLQRKPSTNIDLMQMYLDELRMNEQRIHQVETAQAELLERVETVAAKVTAVNDEFFTLAGYYHLRGQRFNLTTVQAQQTGKTLKRKSQELGYVVGSSHSERYGRVNTYHKFVLQVVLGF